MNATFDQMMTKMIIIEFKGSEEKNLCLLIMGMDLTELEIECKQQGYIVSFSKILSTKYLISANTAEEIAFGISQVKKKYDIQRFQVTDYIPPHLKT